MLSPEQETELKSIVYNTLDFCGGIVTAVREWCWENEIDYAPAVEQLVFHYSMEYTAESKNGS